MIIDLYIIKNIIKTKSLFGIRTNCQKQDVLYVFGNPIDYAKQHKSYPEILGYGALQFFLINDRITSFSFDGSKLDFYDNIKMSPIRKEHIDDFLFEKNISFFKEAPVIEGGEVYKIDGRIDILFYENTLFSFGICEHIQQPA
ncbi:hypothetical protein [Moraxella porci]|uniref:hypothetical protein n=1 Tax=Moraxella porci TaxID=1288392 RepID=UPI00117C8BEC|nr:hypothetical protein [Moraxella porci]